MPDLESFRNEVKKYLSYASSFATGRRLTQNDLANALIMDKGHLSKKLNGKIPISHNDVKLIIQKLAELKTLTTRQEVEALLDLMDCPRFTPQDWNIEPLSSLKNKPLISNRIKPSSDNQRAIVSENTELISYSNKDEASLEITEAAPLLLGILIDLSRSVIDTLEKTPKRSNISPKQLNESINFIVRKTIDLCRNEDTQEVLPKISLFLYGYGFGNLLEASTKFFQNLGLQKKKPLPVSESVRDLFAGAASKEKLPLTPTAADLNENQEYYRRSVESQFADMGLGNSVLDDGLLKIYERFKVEQLKPYSSTPILFLISDGQLHSAKEEILKNIVDAIQEMGVQIVCCYLAPKNVIRTKNLYTEIQPNWTNEAIRLFNCSSQIQKSNKVVSSIVETLKDKGWKVPEHARLFAQVNQSDLLKELIEAILNPLKSDN